MSKVKGVNRFSVFACLPVSGRISDVLHLCAIQQFDSGFAVTRHISLAVVASLSPSAGNAARTFLVNNSFNSLIFKKLIVKIV